MEHKHARSSHGALVFQRHFSSFHYDVETIGRVALKRVELNDDVLVIVYTYQYDGRQRMVESRLQQVAHDEFEGTCTTTEHNAFVLRVNTKITFRQDGTALGNWSWQGQPKPHDAFVRITKM